MAVIKITMTGQFVLKKPTMDYVILKVASR